MRVEGLIVRTACAAVLLLCGCHGIQVGVGVDRTFADGGSAGSVMGKHGFAGAWDVETEDSTTVGVYASAWVTPQTVVLRDERVHEHVLYPPPPSTVTDFEPKSVPPSVQADSTYHGLSVSANSANSDKPPTEDPDIDWEEVVVAVALGLIPLLFGGRYAVRKVRAKRAKKEG